MKFTVFNIAIGLILFVSAITALFGGIQLINILLDWLLGVEMDAGRIKRDLSNSLAMVLVAKPLAAIAYFKLGGTIFRKK